MLHSRWNEMNFNHFHLLLFKSTRLDIRILSHYHHNNMTEVSQYGQYEQNNMTTFMLLQIMGKTLGNFFLKLIKLSLYCAPQTKDSLQCSLFSISQSHVYIYKTGQTCILQGWGTCHWDSYTLIKLPPSWFLAVSATWEELLNYRGGP